MRLIDTDKLPLDIMPEDVDKAPTISAVPVVRCRECKHYKPEEYFSPCILPQGLECAKPDDFCSYGQRKEAAHD